MNTITKSPSGAPRVHFNDWALKAFNLTHSLVNFPAKASGAYFLLSKLRLRKHFRETFHREKNSATINSVWSVSPGAFTEIGHFNKLVNFFLLNLVS